MSRIYSKSIEFTQSRTQIDKSFQCAVCWYFTDIPPANLFICLKSFRQVQNHFDLKYGNTGCWVFKRGEQNWKDFSKKSTYSEEIIEF